MTETVVLEQRVSGRPEDAFAYFTDPAKHVQWQGVRADLEPRPGGEYVVHFTDHSRIRGQYVEVDPPRRLLLSWGWESDSEFPPGSRDVPAGSTTVEITFHPDGDDTLITLIHRMLPPGEFVGLADRTWGLHIERLVRVLAGEAVDPEPLVALLPAFRGEAQTSP